MTRFHVVICRLILPSLILAFCSNAHAQSVDAMEKELAGTHAREWVFKKFETYMSAAKKCRQGESYRFKTDHTVTISRCVDGETHDETEQWSLVSDEMDTRLTLGSTQFIVKFWDTGRGHFMKLRTKPTIKTEPTIDKTFQLAED